MFLVFVPLDPACLTVLINPTLLLYRKKKEVLIFKCLINGNDGACGFSPTLDMLQLISNQEMEFVGLFDNPPYAAPPPTQELPGLTQSSTSAAPATTTATPPSTSSSILSSSPHLDALLGPPITRSSSTPDKTFQPPTFQQSPLAQVPCSTQRQQPASTQQVQSQPKVEQPQTNLNPPAPSQTALPHGSPGPSPAFSSTPQSLFTTPSPQTPLQPQPTQTTFINQNSYAGKHILRMLRVHSHVFWGGLVR